jgi:enamine deaminase RidA (YjgF/YER057c/UK114 family)
MDDKPSVEQLVDVYIKIRDAKEAAKREWEIRNTELEEQMDLVSSHILEICKETGADSIRTKFGTASRTVKSRYWTNNWEEFYKFMMSHEAPDLLEKRIHQTNMKQFLEENPDVLPAGLNVDSQYTITVRRSK